MSLQLLESNSIRANSHIGGYNMTKRKMKRIEAKCKKQDDVKNIPADFNQEDLIEYFVGE